MLRRTRQTCAWSSWNASLRKQKKRPNEPMHPVGNSSVSWRMSLKQQMPWTEKSAPWRANSGKVEHLVQYTGSWSSGVLLYLLAANSGARFFTSFWSLPCLVSSMKPCVADVQSVLPQARGPAICCDTSNCQEGHGRVLRWRSGRQGRCWWCQSYWISPPVRPRLHVMEWPIHPPLFHWTFSKPSLPKLAGDLQSKPSSVYLEPLGICVPRFPLFPVS